MGTLIEPLAAWFIVFPLLHKTQSLSMRGRAPRWYGTLGQLLALQFTSEFYWAHRALHSRWLYALIHKKHHEFTVPSALAAESATSAEAWVAGVLPALLSVMLLARARKQPVHGSVFVWHTAVHTALACITPQRL